MISGTRESNAVGWDALAPAVEAEVDQCDLLVGIAHEDRPVVAHPRVVQLNLEQLDPRRTASAAPRPAARYARASAPARTPRRRWRRRPAAPVPAIGLRPEIALSADVRLRPAGPGHQRELVGRPFRGHGKSVVAWCAGHTGLVILGPASPSWSAGLCKYPPMADSIEVNRAYWDERVAAHAASPEYAVARFAEDPSYLSEVVRFDRPRLGDLTAWSGSPAVPHRHRHRVARPGWARGDRPGLLRPGAVGGAARWRRQPGSTHASSCPRCTTRSRCWGGALRLVYTGVGALYWLPNRPVGRGGGHPAASRRPAAHPRGPPVLWSLELDRPDGLLVLEYPYFETTDPVILDDRRVRRHLRPDRPDVRHQDHARVEPRPR